MQNKRFIVHTSSMMYSVVFNELPPRYRIAYHFWLWTATIGLLVGIVAPIFWSLWFLFLIPVSCIIGTVTVCTGSEFVIEHAKNDPKFRDFAIGTGVLQEVP
jgi:hypothetical protein